jgi:hypothetical protein
MAITAKLREDGSGGNENPWASDLDAVSIAIGNNGDSGTQNVQIANSRIELVTGLSVRQHAIGAASDFANGVVRAKCSVSHAGGSDNNSTGLELRTTGANDATGIQAMLKAIDGAYYLRVRNSWGTLFNFSTTIVAGVLYEVVLNAYGTDQVRACKFDVGAFPPGSDYKTISWDIDRTGGDGFPSAAGKVGVTSERFMATQTTSVVDDLVAYATGSSVDVGSVVVTGGDLKVTVAWTDVAALQKRGTAWYFLRYKSGSEPINQDDGTLVTGAGTGLGGSAIRADGRFLDDPANFEITGLTNGLTYYVRPFAVMWDGTVIAGTSDNDPTAGGSGAPPPPSNFVSAYASPNVSQRVDLSWTNPTIAGDYRINRRTDQYPVSATDGAATVVQDWIAYTANSAGSKQVTALTNGTRYFFALWLRDAGLNVNTGSFIQGVPVATLTLDSPADAATNVSNNPYLVWNTAAGEAEAAKPVHYKVEVSTSEADENAFVSNRIWTLSSLDDGVAGFEYEASATVWAPLLATGLADADVGKDVRARFPLTTTGHLYWRVSPQQAGT